jgi:hypothetical protein
VIHTDVFRRALPWGRLIVGEGAPGSELNTSRGERLCALVAWGLVGAALLWAAGVLPFPAAVVSLALAAGLNRRLLALFARRGGWWFALRALLQHQLYYLYASLVYLFCLAERLFRRPS